jgi:hypothetical protein
MKGAGKNFSKARQNAPLSKSGSSIQPPSTDGGEKRGNAPAKKTFFLVCVHRFFFDNH